MSSMTGAEAVVNALLAEKVMHVFGIPGTQNLPLIDVLSKTPEIRFVLPRHEQTASFMAYGYARAMKQAAVCTATEGPGVTNLMSGIAAAYKAYVPVIAIAGMPDRRMHQKDAMQLLDQVRLFEPITKWSYLAASAEMIPECMRKAFRVALADVPGPVHLSISKEFLLQELQATELRPSQYRVLEGPGCDPSKVQAALKLLEAAKSPIMIVGRETLWSEATKDVIRLAEALAIPVTTILDSMDAFPTTHPLSLGPMGRSGWPMANEAIRNSDLILAIGAKFDWTSTLLTNEIIPENIRIVQVSASPDHIGVAYPVELAVVGGLRSFLRQAAEWAEATSFQCPWLNLPKLKKAWEEKRISECNPGGTFVKAQYIFRTLRGLLDPDAITVVDGGNFGKHMRRHFDTFEPDTFYYNDEFGCVGSALPVAMGIKLAKPKKQVLCIAGDMGFMMNIGELETALRERISVLCIVFNDQGLGNERAWQKALYGGRLYGVDYENPNFAKVAEAFGAYGEQITRARDFEGAVKRSLASGKPAVIELLIDKEDLAPVVYKAGK